MHSVIAAKLQEVVSFLNEPFAEIASLALDHAVFTNWIVFHLDLEMHLLDLFRCKSLLLYGFYHFFRRCIFNKFRVLFINGRCYWLADCVTLVIDIRHLWGILSGRRFISWITLRSNFCNSLNFFSFVCLVLFLAFVFYYCDCLLVLFCEVELSMS